MPRELKPCGTVAAARRHQRKGEPVCEPCRQALRDEKNGRQQVKRAADAQRVQVAIKASLNVEEDLDPLEEALDSLRIVRAVLRDGETPANTIAGLTKRRDELVDRIKALREAERPAEVSLIDELTNRRRERRATAAG